MLFLSGFFDGITLSSVVSGIAIFLLSVLVSFAIIAFVLVKLPAKYFSHNYKHEFLPGRPWIVRVGAILLKNAIGILLILLGIALSLPGIPGQGLLTIFIGVVLLDLPFTRPLERWILARPTILHAVNKLRAKYKKPPFEID